MVPGDELGLPMPAVDGFVGTGLERGGERIVVLFLSVEDVVLPLLGTYCGGVLLDFGGGPDDDLDDDFSPRGISIETTIFMK